MRPIPRGVMIFLSVFTLLSVAGGAWSIRSNEHLFWVELVRFFPPWLAWFGRALLVVFSLLLLCYAALRWLPQGLKIVAEMLGCCFAMLSFWMIAVFYDALAGSEGFRFGFPVPMALVGLVMLGVAFGGFMRRPRRESRRPALVCVATVAVCAMVFPLAQMLCYGKTDYRDRADAAVVFGALAHADGSPSDALADRLRTACELYRDGLVRKLVMTGGPGAGAVHETEAMRRFAVAQGVRDEDIVLDHGGVNTAASVASTGPILDRLEARTVLAVSHFYHLPRIKLSYARAGREVYTVPARESYTLTKMPYFMAREVAALWVYYLRAVLP